MNRLDQWQVLIAIISVFIGIVFQQYGSENREAFAPSFRGDIDRIVVEPPR